MKSLSRFWLLVTPWTAAHQAPPSMGFSRQEYWSGIPLPSPKGMISMLQKAKLETRCRPPYSPAPPEDTCSSFQVTPAASHVLLPEGIFWLQGVFSRLHAEIGGNTGTHSLSKNPQRGWAFCPTVTHSSTQPLLDFLSSPVHFSLTGLSGITFQINFRHPNPGLMMCFRETPTMAQFNYGAEEMAGSTPWSFMNWERIQVRGHLVSFWHLGPWF